METLPFLLFLAVHIVSLITGMGAVFVVDTFGLLWLFGKIDLKVVTRVANVTQKLIWIGWVGLVLSGLGLITIKGYVDNLTMIKLFFVVLVGANGIFLHVIKKAMERIPDESAMPAYLKFRIGLASAISQTGWWGAATIGFLHRHWHHYIGWPDVPVLYMIGILIIILVAAFIGEVSFNRKSG